MKPEIIQPADWPVSSVFAHGWEVPAGNRLCFLSGQTGTVRSTGEVPQGIEAQTTQAFANIRQLLAVRGLALSDIVRTTVYLLRQDDVEGFRSARTAALAGHRPASTMLFVNALSNPLHLVEVDVVAAGGALPGVRQ